MAHGEILLVDHDDQEIQILKAALEGEGYQVELAFDGNEALKKVEHILPDCIVSEVDLPVMDGYEFCRKLRELPRLENVPFVFISSQGKNGEDTLKGLKLGADDFVNRPVIPDEVVLRVEVILKRLQILQKLTITDEVTGLFNRRYFDQRLDEEVERLKRYNRPLAVWVIDLDKFKQVNDNFGHAAGDQVLRDVGNFIQDQLRKSDIIARYGGDEFAIIMPEHSGERIDRTGERLRQSVEDHRIDLSEGGNVGVTISMGGVWIAEKSGASSSDIIRMADSRLYEAKGKGRNCVELETS
jgi:two-component system cell cycle response regulator